MAIQTDGIKKDPISTSELQAGSYSYAADAGNNDTYVITLDPAPTALTTGMRVWFKANTANTGACTLNVNGLGAVSLKSLHDQDPQNDYIEAGSIVEVVYDGTNFQILNADANP